MLHNNIDKQISLIYYMHYKSFELILSIIQNFSIIINIIKSWKKEISNAVLKILYM